ncbi:MAG TPA: hypothetical protein VKT25_09060, partial [Ktedonobacteraceae bacterium]|nr:hypothetical protein [Ktedonobacteraceae bacterium]
LRDDYVKFIRFAQWRIQQTGYGILAYISNHRYLTNPTFPGMRQSLMNTFDHLYLLNLHGSSKPKEVPPAGMTDQNVFDIQQGGLHRHLRQIRPGHFKRLHRLLRRPVGATRVEVCLALFARRRYNYMAGPDPPHAGLLLHPAKP